jgi:PKD repeat protein
VLPSIATAGDPVVLDASQSADPDGSVVEYAFDFGDGTDVVRAATPTTPHAYATNGSYTAKVVVTDDRGNVSAPASAKVIVGELVGTGSVDTGAGGVGSGTPATPTRTTVDRPGSESPSKIVPGSGVGLIALAAVGAALAARRHLRR